MKTLTKPRKTAPVPCTRCGGSGQYGPTVVESGICFRCAGHRVDPRHKAWTFPTEWSAEQIGEFLAAEEAKAAAKQAKREEKRKAAEAATWAANVAECPALAELAEVSPDFCHRLRRWQISEKQKALAVAMLDRHRAAVAREAEAAERRAAGVTVPVGRQTIRGIVAGFKTQEGRYGTTQKMIVRSDEGWAVYVTVPAGITPERGNAVEFTATIERSDRDPLFGFASRPAQARIVTDEATAVA